MIVHSSKINSWKIYEYQAFAGCMAHRAIARQCGAYGALSHSAGHDTSLSLTLSGLTSTYFISVCHVEVFKFLICWDYSCSKIRFILAKSHQ